MATGRSLPATWITVAAGTATRGTPHVLWIHLALFVGQLSHGGAAIVGKLGIHGGNPVLFALIREAATGAILMFGGSLLGMAGPPPPPADVRLVLAAGFCVFANHFCYIVGLKLADPVSGSAWQPSQPVFTATLAILVGYEQPSLRKACGILLAVAGALLMVLDSSRSRSSETALLGHSLFLMNCFANSCYFIVSKRLLRRYPPALVTGWVYTVASAFMLAATYTVNQSGALLTFVCSDDDVERRDVCVRDPWRVPPSMVLPLCYYVAFGSLGAYFLVAWANKYAKASVVSAYTVVQTLTSSALSALMIAFGGARWAEDHGFRELGPQDLGVIPIILGLAILFGEPTMQGSDEVPVAKVLPPAPVWIGLTGSDLAVGPSRLGEAAAKAV